MNSQKYKIQALIAEIDEVLSKPAPRLPWTGSIDTVHQRQLLERVRAYLVSSESKVAARKGPPSPTVRPEPVPVPKMPPRIDRPSATEQIMLAVTEEITNLRSSLTGPLQEEIAALRQEQQALIQEIKQLEAKRQQQQSLAQQQANQQQIISEFLQVLTGRLEETLDRDLSQMFGSLENQLLPSSAAQSQQSALSAQTSEELPLLTPAQRLEQMQRFQASADSLLMRLDSTMGIVFEALEANLQSYQASLGQGLENMYGLSQQSEAMFATFVNHLVAQLGREASAYVQQPIALANVETPSPTASDRSVATGAFSNTAIVEPGAAESENRGELGEQDRLPYAGTEISPQFGQLRRDRDRLETPLSLPDLEDNLFGFSPEISPGQLPVEGDGSEDLLTETDDNVEDLYASLFAGETVAELELELEDFTIENTESDTDTEAVPPLTAVERETTETLNSAEDLFANLLDEGESLEDVLAGEDSEFTIGNSVEALTLDTEDLFEPQVTTVAEVSAPSALSSIDTTVSEASEPPALSSIEPQLDSDDRENLEMAQNLGEHFDSAAVPAQPPEPGPATASAADPMSSNQPRNPRVPSARDVQTGDVGSSSQGLNDVYIQASPDEDLLPVEALEDDLDRALKLDVSTMELLEADLYNLEGADNNAPRRSTSSAADSLDLLASSSDGGADNPFVEAADEELGSLEDLFSDELELSSEDEPFVLEDELEDDLFAADDESNLTLDEILASLKDTEPEVAPTPEAEELPSNPRKSQKKNLISRQSKAAVVEEITEPSEFAVLQQQESALHSVPGAIAPSSPPSQKHPNSRWYLGIDFGSSGLSAALLDRASGQLYPIYWETAEGDVSPGTTSFRIPSIAAIEETAPTATSGPQVTVKSVGAPMLYVRAGEFLLQNFKLPLKVGIPYQREAAGIYEPLLQWSSDVAVSIALPLHAVRALLATLNRKHQEQKLHEANSDLWPISDLICKASGLTPEILDAALQDLQGVILGTPASWSQAYAFNLREAVLGADLVASGGQIFVVPDAIATLVAAVTPMKNATGEESAAVDANESSLAEPAPLTVNLSSFSGGTLIVNAGAATVELAVVELPENLQNLTRADFTCQSFEAAGNAFDQDIICQLLAKDETWGMSIDLPRPGHPDLPSRYQLQQRLQASDLGRKLLEVARLLKVILQDEETFAFDIDQQHWEVKRRDLESLVLVPFVQQLNRQLNALLSRAGMSPARINQAICTGGMGGWPAIARWLRQKLPNAIVLQDRILQSDLDISEIHNVASNSGFQSINSSKKSGQVASGLASLALYPQILDVRQQQYSDFFLLWELMQVLGKKTLSFDEILQLLERQGVNTRTCEPRILGILEGRLPAGLVPEEEDFMVLAEESRQNPDWQAILAEPLFFEDVSRGYRLNVEHASVVREYLGKLASSSQQKLLEPLTIAWDVRTDLDLSTVDS